MKHSLLIGAHTSTAGGVHNALYQGQQIGATTVQIFTSNQKQWQGRILTQDDLNAWEKAKEETGIETVMSHASYLINLGAPNEETHFKSRAAFRKEIERCHALNIDFLNFHPGAACGDSVDNCLARIANSLLEVEALATQGPTQLLLEATAGQGSTVGFRFEELAKILDLVGGRLPLGVCIDTCHIFVAGYDVRTAEAWEETLQQFDRIVGLKHLKAFHLNDSMKPFGSRRDRHSPLGKGEIGLECFKFLMQDPRTRALPMYLETPDGPPLWTEELKLLREFANILIA